MSAEDESRGTSRRGILAAAGGLIAAAGSGLAAEAAPKAPAGTQTALPDHPQSEGEAFWGAHQAGIVSPPQHHSYFAAFDLVTTKPGDVTALLRAWTDAAARMTQGQTARPLSADLSQAAGDNGDALDLGAARLSVTFGFGPGLFVKDGHDRYGLASRRPQALVDLPRFNGDQLVPERSGGDLSVQACADDPQVAFHAVRELARIAYDTAQIRWAQSGFAAYGAGGGTPRNLMGFKDGTQNPLVSPVKTAGGDYAAQRNPAGEALIWVGDEGPTWMQGGSYLVARRIRIALEHWERMDVDYQQQVMGRHKLTGAPLGAEGEFHPLPLDLNDKDGNPVIPDNAHVRLATAASNGGAQMLRRAYSYNDGVSFTAERWPPWRQGMEYDAGLFFMAYQRDPRTGFIQVFETMAKLDALNQFTTHVGSGVFACPGGMRPGEFIGQKLFDGIA